MDTPIQEQTYPVLLLRDIVIFPHMIVPLFVGREKSVKALDKAMGGDKKIVLLTQKDPSLDSPLPEELYTTGTIGNVVQLLRLPDGTVKALVEGVERVKIKRFLDNAAFYEAETEAVADKINEKEDVQAFVRSLISQFEEYVRLNKKIPPEIMLSIAQIDDASKLADVIASHLSLKISERQDLLETADVLARVEKLYGLMEAEKDVLQVEKKIRRRVKKQMEKSQRDYYLNEQMKAIQKELGDDDGSAEYDELEAKIKKAKMSAEANAKALSELKKLRHMSPMSSEATVIRNYLDWLIDLPWGKKAKIQTDLAAAEKILDQDHYGLEKVKERILEYLAVQKKTKSVKGPILCLVGPPGVGKTSLGESIARATGRKFVRASLGGMRDEAEIRGHRRTYVGALPGKIIQSMKKVKTRNPLFLLDEIDKLGADWRGDPSSALLEVLDPAQNSTFNDHYLEVDYDLSDVMFITTANSLKMPRPLLDRMEIIRIAGYTEDEKVEIAKRHLIKKQREAAGLKENEWSITDGALRQLIRLYTREAGVRSLDRALAGLARKATKELMTSDKKKSVTVTEKNLKKYAGVPVYTFGVAEKQDLVGVTTGLAWTEVGGEILSIEAVTMPGHGRVIQTGQLGDVMKESISAARSYVRSHAIQFGIRPDLFDKRDIHIHVPEGATPKDGPSAGIAMCTSLVSALTGIPVSKDIAMTGEITLLGRVLPIGGLKEKLLAALRAGIKTVLIPFDNQKDLEEIPDNVKHGLNLIPVLTAEEVLKHALIQPLVPIEWNEDEESHAALSDEDKEPEETVSCH
ncbi:MAG TPA: endopeptidase La [Alphaproteobacteria bacterium]|nr:endopeptidase La [Alphaproteobacteria bacterium]